ncbi:MAG: uridine kinase [Candidatus Woesearchaeota archaeon]|nr:MAG: uridine kinase [Candidatus Woesearchaeota archaeon]
MSGKELSLLEALKEVPCRVADLLATKNIVLIGLSGGSGSGKGFVARHLKEKIPDCAVLSMDDYYFGKEKITDGNFDKPESLDLKLLVSQLQQLKQGKNIQKPEYDFVTSSRNGEVNYAPSKVILLEGLFALIPEVAKELDLKLLVVAKEPLRYVRRCSRDQKTRGRSKESIALQWKTFAEPMFQLHKTKQEEQADIIIKNEKKFVKVTKT